MATCKNCGAELPEGAQFCYKCGVSTAQREEFMVDSDQLIETIKRLIHEGNIRRIIVNDENDNLLMEIPVTVGIIGALLSPWLAALGAIAAIATRCKIIVEKRK